MRSSVGPKRHAIHDKAMIKPRRAMAFGVGGEVALQMRPAQLSTGKRQMGVCPPAIEGDDRLGVGAQGVGPLES